LERWDPAIRHEISLTLEEQFPQSLIPDTWTVTNMSTIKSPPQKKELSLAFDRRNDYGENSKASRKNITRGKKRSHRHERRGVTQLLASIPFKPDTEDVLATSLAVKMAHPTNTRRPANKALRCEEIV
jgi:hypothetical protein